LENAHPHKCIGVKLQLNQNYLIDIQSVVKTIQESLEQNQDILESFNDQNINQMNIVETFRNMAEAANLL